MQADELSHKTRCMRSTRSSIPQTLNEPPARPHQQPAAAAANSGQSATFRCSKFLDLVEKAAWAAATKPEASPQGYRQVAGEFLAALELALRAPSDAGLEPLGLPGCADAGVHFEGLHHEAGPSRHRRGAGATI